MLERLARSPRVRGGLLAAFLACCGYGLYAVWPQAMTALDRLHWYFVTLALAAAMAGAWCMMLAWRAVLADLGSPLPLRAAASACFVAQLGKYVPGAVWAFAAQVELGRDAGAPRRRGVAAVAVSLAVAVGAGLGVAALTLPFTSPHELRHLWWAFLIVPVILLGLCPPVLGRLIDRVLVRTGRAAPGAPADLGRAGPRARLDGARLAGVRDPGVAAAGRHWRRRRARPVGRDRRVRAGVRRRVAARRVPERDRRARSHPHRRTGTGGTTQRSAGRCPRRSRAHHILGPSLGGLRAGDEARQGFAAATYARIV